MTEAGDIRAVGTEDAIDADRLAQWMRANVADFVGPLTIDRFTGGQSNPTYRLITPKARYVLRCKPPGSLLQGAHAVDREARVMQALGGVGFPVPRIHALCTNDNVIGTWFCVMDLVDSPHLLGRRLAGHPGRGTRRVSGCDGDHGRCASRA